MFLAFILLREMLVEDAGLFRYYTQHAYIYYTVERIYSVQLYIYMSWFVCIDDGGHVDTTLNV